MSYTGFIKRFVSFLKIQNDSIPAENRLPANAAFTEPIVIDNMSGYKISVQNDQLFRLCPIYSCNARPGNGTISLALQLYTKETVIAGFLHKLRSSIAKKQDHFMYVYESKEEREAIKSILPSLLDGYLTETNEIMTEKVFIRIALIPNVIWFLNGGYLELALAEIAENVMKELNASTGCSYRIYRNAVLKGEHYQNEFDLLIDVNEDLRFAVEAKSGSNFRDYARYTCLMSRYGIIPDYFLLSQSGLSDDSAERIQDAVGYQVCSNKDFEERFKSLILNQIPVSDYQSDITAA